ncbi:hypothetical protein BDFG_06519 [Blastomyces dermatitidis ATCC 26199]|nr:hypothetical protein BDFG_06519 [Blastomyces dermatitidis ATCC 26199]
MTHYLNNAERDNSKLTPEICPSQKLHTTSGPPNPIATDAPDINQHRHGNPHIAFRLSPAPTCPYMRPLEFAKYVTSFIGAKPFNSVLPLHLSEKSSG